MRILDALLDLIFPPRCLVCGTIGIDPFCGKCLSSIVFAPGGPVDDHVVSATVYDGVIKEAIRKFKFLNKKVLSAPLSGLLIDHLAKHPCPFDLKKIQLVISVPLHKNRQEGRGFNQSSLLAEDVAEFIGVPFKEGVLSRTRDTKPQFDLTREERLKNVIGAFEVTHGGAVANKNILLIDDILTTGATVSECVKALKSAGAGMVSVMTLARA